MGNGGKYVPPEMIEKARQMDLYSYMEVYEPDNLVRVCAGRYQLREHDSVVISNGLWVQKSSGIGGRSALDYLVKVRGIPFQEAVEQLSGVYLPDRKTVPVKERSETKELQLPPLNRSAHRVISYLSSRGISKNIIDHCVKNGLIYESAIYHSVVFVGLDYENNTPKYACQRGCFGSNFKGEASGSNKRFGFRIEAPGSEILHIFEAPIDLLSYATLMEIWGKNWHSVSFLALGGVAPQKNGGLPMALSGFLEHRTVDKIYLHLDNDKAGRNTVDSIMRALPAGIMCADRPAPEGKDINDYLKMLLKKPGEQPEQGRNGASKATEIHP